jgi:uncharacterized protein
MLRDNGCPEWLARIAERHTGAGITADDIIARQLPLPVADYTPQTQLERLICYADKFYSKSRGTDAKPLERVIASMSKFSADTLQRFEALHKEFALK